MTESASTCPHCQAPIAEGTRFCGSCGKSVAASGSPSTRPPAKTMMGLDAATVMAAAQRARDDAAPPAAAPAAPQERALAKTMMGVAGGAYMPPAAAPAPAAVTPAQPAPQAPASNKAFAARTMIGGAGFAPPGPPQAAPQPTAAPQQAAAPSAVDNKRTMLGGAGFLPPAAAPQPSAAQPAAAARSAAGAGRTMLGVPLSASTPGTDAGARADDARESGPTGTELDSFSTSPGSEFPADRPYDADTMSLKLPSKRPLWIVIAIAVVVLGVAAALLMRTKSEPRSDVSARVVSIDAGEALLFEVQSAPAGSKLRFGGQEKELKAGRATFALAADSLRVGDNVVLADVVYPDGTTEATRITLAVYYRIWVDTAALRADKSAVDVVVTALPGTRVTLDGEDLKLDAEGRATRSYPIDIVGDAKSGMIDHIVKYRVQPPSGETVVDTLRTQLPVAMMQIDRPGREVVTDRTAIEISGVVSKGTQVSIDGMSVPVKDTRFLYSFPLPQAQTYKPRVVASAAGKAPMGVTLEIRRVDDLAQAAAEFVADPQLNYAKLAPNPSIYRGQKISIEGRVYSAYSRGADSYLQMFARPCPSSQTCAVWVSDSSATEVHEGDWVRVLGIADGEQQFRDKKNDDVVTVPKVQARFVLPAKP